MSKLIRSATSLWTLVGSAVVALLGYLADINSLLSTEVSWLWDWIVPIALVVFFGVLVARDVIRQEQVDAIKGELTERKDQDNALTLLDAARAILRRNRQTARVYAENGVAQSRNVVREMNETYDALRTFMITLDEMGRGGAAAIVSYEIRSSPHGSSFDPGATQSVLEWFDRVESALMEARQDIKDGRS